ncbi:hypothetical protein XELAEV_18030798mg [Xenopus laevis]|uniref:Uncharacterized protein n=1 Tax=Xenopus laevis TaxID=8355 RepID=A0A974CLF0_XENLA|nr:hypothetical protein XELAEV_18030798mg [Xenopus laevis]
MLCNDPRSQCCDLLPFFCPLTHPEFNAAFLNLQILECERVLGGFCPEVCNLKNKTKKNKTMGAAAVVLVNKNRGAPPPTCRYMD